MSRRSKRSDEPRLFDLPLTPPERKPAPDRPGQENDEAEAAAASGPRRQARRPEPLPLFTTIPAGKAAGTEAARWATAPPPAAAARPGAAAAPPAAAAAAGPPDGEPHYEEEATASTQPVPASITDRAGAGLLDLAVLLAVGMVLAGGVLALGARPPAAAWPAAALFFLPFSYLYVVLPMAFWGRTPGMTWAGLVARGLADQPPTFRQATLRWLGALLTVAFAGLPLLLTLADSRSLTDRLSGTRTLSGSR